MGQIGAPPAPRVAPELREHLRPTDAYFSQSRDPEVMLSCQGHIPLSSFWSCQVIAIGFFSYALGEAGAFASRRIYMIEVPVYVPLS